MSHTVHHRFVFTLGASIVRGGISWTTALLLARWLGPEEYGRMTYLLATFLALRSLLDMGSSSAFFTFLSQSRRSTIFVRRYYYWLALQFTLPLLVIGLVFPQEWLVGIWKGESRSMILLALTASFMQNGIWSTVSNQGESKRQTALVQSISTWVALVHLVATVTLWLVGWLGLYAVFAAIAVEFLLASVYGLRRLTADSDIDARGEDKSAPGFRKYFSYCLPMAPYVMLGFAAEFADRWMLQTYGGSVEQAYYAVGAQFASISLIATSSVLRIFWKEIAEAHHQGDRARMRGLYENISRLLFFVGALIAGFFMPWVETILKLLLGAAYATGATTLAIMFLYPIHQSLGQITSSFLYATENVSVQVLTGLVQMAIGIPVTYLVLAPPDAVIPGLDLASNGVAIKMVALQFLGVNVTMYLIARTWQWRYDWTYQPIGLLCCLAIGYLAHSTTVAVFAGSVHILAQMLIAAICYAALSFGVVMLAPWLVGSTKNELIGHWHHLNRTIFVRGK